MPDRLVYSTDGGRVSNCPRCGLPYKQCRCDQPSTGSGSGSGGQPAKKGDGIVRIMRDRKHRGGKTVTVITGIPANQRSEEHTSELQSQSNLVCRLLPEKKNR